MSSQTEAEFFEYNAIENFARWYLDTYYACDPTEDERVINAFLIAELQRLNRQFDCYVEVGCGGTLHHAVPITPYVQRICMCDYRADNQREILAWRDGHPEAFSWDHYITLSLETEKRSSTEDAIAERRTELRSKIVTVSGCDVRAVPVVSGELDAKSLVGLFFVGEEVGTNLEGWRQVMTNIAATLPSGAHLFVTALRGMNEYKVQQPSGDSDMYPCAPVTEHHFSELLPTLGFSNPIIKTHLITKPDVEIPGIVMVSATKT